MSQVPRMNRSTQAGGSASFAHRFLAAYGAILACTLPVAAVLVVLWGALAVVAEAEAGECVGAMDAPAIIRAFATVHPDSLPPEAQYLLGCLDDGVSRLRYRAYGQPPSWRLMRNTRRRYRDLGRNPELVRCVGRLGGSRDARTRSAANLALALYGQPVDRDTLFASTPHLQTRAMVLAVLGDSAGVRVAIEAYPSARDPGERGVFLDALYYQATAAAGEFIRQVAAHPPDAKTGERVRWMLEHPFSREASWRP